MKAVISCSRGTFDYQFDGSESALWKKVGKSLKFMEPNDTMTISVGSQQAQLFKSDYVKCVFNNITCLTPSLYKKAVLEKIDPDSRLGGYQFYKINPHNLGLKTVSFGGSYGRIGSDKTDLDHEKNIKLTPSYMYWIRYYEKLDKGYEDYTDKLVDEDEKPSWMKMLESEKTAEESLQGIKVQDMTPAQKLFKKLSDAAQAVVQAVFTADFLSGKPKFTHKQVEQSWEVWNSLGESKSIVSFNKKIKTLLAICPRKIDRFRGQTVESFFARKFDDKDDQKAEYARIIDREESYIRAMEATLAPAAEDKSLDGDDVLFPGIKITDASEEEVEMVKKQVGSGHNYTGRNLKDMVHHVWRVEPVNQRERFEAYCENRKIKERKLLFHGSKTENWISIIRNSLLLNPNAAITGKAFGYGIYFALDAGKSFGYTSHNGTIWAHGNASVSYMGLYETAYGKSLDANKAKEYTGKAVDDAGCDCLHYHAGSGGYGFRMDEIIFYNEEAVCLKYLIEFMDEGEK